MACAAAAEAMPAKSNAWCVLARRSMRATATATPLHVAVFMRKQDATRTLLRLGADPNALESQQYDIVTIAAVADDVPMLRIALDGGCRPNNITSPYQGTALIAAAHLGHVEVVRTLIAAGAPLDHVNNLGWTALIESIVLGDGGKSYRCTQGSCRSRRQGQSATVLAPRRSRSRRNAALPRWQRFSKRLAGVSLATSND